MALPSTLYIDPQPWRVAVFGKAINVVPGDPTIPVEIQRASDALGTGATTIATGLLFPTAGAPYVDQRANDGSSWYYRARHAGPGYDAGAYTSPWVGGIVKPIPKDVLAASVNYGGGSVYPLIRAKTWNDGLYAPRTQDSTGLHDRAVAFVPDSQYALRATQNDGSTKTSTAHNPQGAILPVPFGGSLFTGAWGGIGAGQMFVAFSWAAQTLRLPDGSTISMPVPPAPLSAPTLGQTAGGTRGALTLFARIGLVKDGHVYAVSSEASFAVSANNLLTITSPGSVAGYDGWCVLINSATNTEFLQDATVSTPIAFGTNYTEPGGHFSTAGTQWTAAWQNAVIYADLNPTTTYYFYPFWDIANAITRFAPTGIAVGDTAPSSTDANKAWSDGRIPLSGAGMQIAIGAGGGSGSPSTGGSRLV